RAHGAHRVDRARAGADCALHRARHGRRLRGRGARHGAAPGARHRRGRTGHGAHQPGSAGGVPGGAGGGDVMLELRRVHAYYGRSHVLYGVDLAAREGEVVCLLGRNGAGKTTTLKAVVGLVDVTGGEILYQGRSLAGLRTHEISRAGIGFVPEDRRIFSDLTVAENLEVGERPGGTWTRERVSRLFPRLRELAGRRGGSLSGGEQQMLTIARTLMTSPRLLLLDEPSEGLAPVVVRALAENIAALKGGGLTILLSEQNVRFARRLDSGRTGKDAAPMVRWAKAHGMTVTIHTGGPSIAGSSPIGADVVLEASPDVVGHINGGTTSLTPAEIERLVATDMAVEIVQCGNVKAALHTLRVATAARATHRIIVGNDAPSGTGVIPLGVLRTLSLLAAVGGLPPAEAGAC